MTDTTQHKQCYCVYTVELLTQVVRQQLGRQIYVLFTRLYSANFYQHHISLHSLCVCVCVCVRAANRQTQQQQQQQRNW